MHFATRMKGTGGVFLASYPALAMRGLVAAVTSAVF
jgi:hypothetical protein